MKYLLFLLFLPSYALAYDDIDAAGEFGRCLHEKQYQNHYHNGAALVQACQPQYRNFIYYCGQGIGREQCEIIVAHSVYAVMGQVR